MALTNDTGNTGLPVQLGQGMDVLRQNGISVTGGSTVNPSTTFVSQPGTPMSMVYLGGAIGKGDQDRYVKPRGAGPDSGPVGFGGYRSGNLDYTGTREVTYEDARNM